MNRHVAWYNRAIEKHPALAGRGMSQSGVSTMTTPSIPPTKTCTKCGETFPATTEYFSSIKYSKDKLSYHCRKCLAQAQREYRKNNPDKVRKTERKRAQSPQRRQWQKEWRQKNITKVREHRRVFYRKHSEYIKAWQQEHRKNNPEYMREYNRQYREANRERLCESERQWRQKNPDKVRANERNRRAREYNAEGGHTAKELQQQFKRQKGKCYYCNSKLDKNDYHADHVIPLSRGGSNYISNIVCTCPVCNLRKHDKLPHEWEGTDKLL